MGPERGSRISELLAWSGRQRSGFPAFIYGQGKEPAAEPVFENVARVSLPSGPRPGGKCYSAVVGLERKLEADGLPDPRLQLPLQRRLVGQPDPQGTG